MGVECDIDELKHQAWLRVEEAMNDPEGWRVQDRDFYTPVFGIPISHKNLNVDIIRRWGYPEHVLTVMLNDVKIKQVRSSCLLRDGMIKWRKDNPSPLIDPVTGLVWARVTKTISKRYDEWSKAYQEENDRLKAEEDKANEESGFTKINGLFEQVQNRSAREEECRRMEKALGIQQDECKKLEKALGVNTPQTGNTVDVEIIPQQEDVVDSGSEHRVRLPWYKRLFR